MELHNPLWTPDVTFSSDASGSWGCGAVWYDQWIQCAWNNLWMEKGIAIKELLPIVLAIAIWGDYWVHKRVLVRCDNMAVVHVINCLRCKDPTMLHLMHCLHFFTAHYDIRLRAVHLEGILNIAADSVSRNNLQIFRKTVPQSSPLPTSIPPSPGSSNARLVVSNLEIFSAKLLEDSIAPST